MRMERAGHVYPPYRIKPDRALARKLMAGLGLDGEPVRVPPTYMIFLRGETLGVDLFTDLDIPRQKALHGGQRYEWFAPVTVGRRARCHREGREDQEKQGKRGPIWFADVSFEYRRTRDGSAGIARGHAPREAIVRLPWQFASLATFCSRNHCRRPAASGVAVFSRGTQDPNPDPCR